MVINKANNDFMVGVDGGLYNTNVKNWADCEPLRPDFCKHKLECYTLNDVKASLRAGEFTFPGGYRLAFITSDAACLSFDAVKNNWHSVVWDWINEASTGWRVVGLMNVDELDESLYCDETNELLNDPESDY